MEEAKKSEVGSVSDIVNIINRTKEVFNYEVWIPSLETFVRFREMNTAQQKRIIKTIVDSSAYNTEFILVLRDIIKENCVDSSVNVDELTIIDKMLIALNMRMVSIGGTITLNLKSSTGKEAEYNVDLSEIAKKFPNIKNEQVEIVDDKGIFKVIFALPTISEEYNLEKELRNNSKSTIENNDDVKDTIGNIFSSELSKYIKQLSIKNEETNEIVEIDLKELNFKSRIKIVESLPSKLINMILKKIASINKQVEEVFIIKANIDGEEIVQKMRINSSFFMDS